MGISVSSAVQSDLGNSDGWPMAAAARIRPGHMTAPPLRASVDSAGALGASGGVLTIDLSAVAENYRLLKAEASGSVCAAVVKADAYGLGVARIGALLQESGCRHFFVADVKEGVALREAIGAAAFIYVLHGVLPGTADTFVEHRLTPVLNGFDQMALWADAARSRDIKLPAILHFDTGMTRLGFSEADVRYLAEHPDSTDCFDIKMAMSHLACADDSENPENEHQLARFERLCRIISCPASLAASSGIFLGSGFHLDLVRPGAALYGLAPRADRPNMMQAVIKLEGRVVQVSDVSAGIPVGYGHTAKTAAVSRLATIGIGYADGYLRSLSNRGCVWFGDTRLPVMGRVSMDSIIIDVTALPPETLHLGSLVELIGPHQDVDAVARQAGTIGYEILTSLGTRYHRRYVWPREV